MTCSLAISTLYGIFMRHQFLPRRRGKPWSTCQFGISNHSRLRQSATYTSAVTRRVVQVAAGCRWAAKPEACKTVTTTTAFFHCCCSGPSRPVLDNRTLATCPHAPQFHADAEGLPTPSLDRLVKEGVAVSQCYSPQCAPHTLALEPPSPGTQ